MKKTGFLTDQSGEGCLLNADYKQFLLDDWSLGTVEGGRLICDMLKEEGKRDYRLAPSQGNRNMSPATFPFNRHTVTIGIGNEIIDFETTRVQHERLRDKQLSIAKEIELAKDEIKKVRQIEQAWYQDFINDKYVNDLSQRKKNLDVSNDDVRKSISDSLDDRDVKPLDRIRRELSLFNLFEGIPGYEEDDKSDCSMNINDDDINSDMSHATFGSGGLLNIMYRSTDGGVRKFNQYIEKKSPGLPTVNI
ncbi:uncharacterized protein LOC127872413 [Dreissena polymorpha]|uniref:Uncharacterized protein n=1 Tax=Dreissena polymorpha TaxID=45954 RepID=A0A9D4MKJ2_DREPO|nr:uncharacterized protein LOC127872413 [Dreissena polymorpha]KAH3877684.1 hypothetical protein DPMN_001560 [Dreissena polymorpha]